jgi:hypothetical protein
VLLLCAALAAYALYLMVVGTTYVSCQESLPAAATDGCRTHLEQVPQASIPLGLTLLIAIAVAFKRTPAALFFAVLLAGFGFLTGFSIGPPIFLGALLIIVLLAARYATLGNRADLRPLG